MSEERSERSDGRIVKMEIDYSSTVDQRLPECEKMAKVSSGRERPAPAESWCGRIPVLALELTHTYLSTTRKLNILPMYRVKIADKC